MNAYRLRRNDNSYGPANGLKQTLAKAREIMLQQGGPFVVQKVGGPSSSPRRSRQVTVMRLGALLPLAEPGEVIRIFTRGGEGTRVAIRVIDKLPQERPPWASQYLDGKVRPTINRVAEVAYAYDPDVDCLGALVCKRVSGSSVWSQHAYGAAIDLAFRVPPPVGFNLKRQDDLASYLVKHAKELVIGMVIHRDDVWTPSQGWHRYSGIAHTHVHVQCLPEGSGTPDCAR
jgi:hypothetical protein